MASKQQQGGFTLIEIAIVLVIIGLLLGGILKGQELITQAKIRNVVNDFNGTTAAFYSYQERYRAIPGDDKNAKTRWTIATSAIPNGNGTVDGKYNDANGKSEAALFWQHLRLAGLIAGSTADTSPPQNAVAGITGVQGTGALGINGLVICSSNLPAKIAQAVDSQLDDSNATTGQVRGAIVTGGTAPDIPDSSTADYVDDAKNTYVVCKSI